MDYDGIVATINAVDAEIVQLIRECLNERGFDTEIQGINQDGTIIVKVEICY